MQKSLEREWDLSIGPDTVRMFVLKARAISASINDDYTSGHEHEVELQDQSHDGHHHDGLQEEEEEDLTREELVELIDDLNVDETAELVAIAWIGRGDYDTGEWAEAVSEARLRGRKKAAAYLLGMPMLGDYLEEGLEAIGA